MYQQWDHLDPHRWPDVLRSRTFPERTDASPSLSEQCPDLPLVPLAQGLAVDGLQGLVTPGEWRTGGGVRGAVFEVRGRHGDMVFRVRSVVRF